jgi:uncharacterized membrane protein
VEEEADTETVVEEAVAAVEAVTAAEEAVAVEEAVTAKDADIMMTMTSYFIMLIAFIFLLFRKVYS